MTSRDAREHLFDIAQACELLERFTTGTTLAGYQADPMRRSAVERQFEIVGEALRRAIDLDPSLEGRISDAARIVALRNRLIHGYASVSDKVVWGIVETNLPTLRAEVQALLKEASPDG